MALDRRAMLTGAGGLTLLATAADATAQEPALRGAGATGLNDVRDGAAVQAVLDRALPGERVRGTRGGAAAAAFKITGGSFTLGRMVDLDLDRGVDLRSDQRAGERLPALAVNVLLADGDLGSAGAGVDQAPNTGGDARGMWLRGGRVFTHALGGADELAAGGYALDINGAAGRHKGMIGLTVEKMLLAGGEGAVRFGSSPGHELQWCQLVRCTLTNGTRFAAEDGEIAVDCVAGGANAAYTFDLTYGAYCAGVFRGTAANTGGAIDVVNGSFVKVHDLQAEHGGARDNPQTHGAQAIVRGERWASEGVEFIGVNFGAGSHIGHTVALLNARHTKLYYNQWYIAREADLLLDVHASDPARDAYDTIVGYDQNYRGARPLVGLGRYTDVQRRMVIRTPAGRPLRQPHRGIWYPGFALLTERASGLADDDFELLIEHSGRLAFNGGVQRAAGFAEGLTVARFPAWLLPVRTQRMAVHGRSRTGVAELRVGGADSGALIVRSDLAGERYLYIASPWMAVVNPYYREVR